MKMCNDKNFKQLTDAIGRIEHYLGTTNNPEEKTVTWNINEIKSKLDILLNSFYIYQSENKTTKHIIKHNFDSIFLEINIMSEEEDGWENLLCKVKYTDTNTIEINLCEEKNLIVTIYKIK